MKIHVKTKRYTLILLTGLLPSVGFGQKVHVKGIGTESCGNYIEFRKKENTAQNDVFVSWIWGYIAGFNIESEFPTPKAIPDQASTLAYFDKYCRDNPLSNLIQGTNALIDQLGGSSSLNRVKTK